RVIPAQLVRVKAFLHDLGPPAHLAQLLLEAETGVVLVLGLHVHEVRVRTVYRISQRRNKLDVGQVARDQLWNAEIVRRIKPVEIVRRCLAGRPLAVPAGKVLLVVLDTALVMPVEEVQLLALRHEDFRMLAQVLCNPRRAASRRADDEKGRQQRLLLPFQRLNGEMPRSGASTSASAPLMPPCRSPNRARFTPSRAR